MEFQLTEKQKEANRLLGSDARHILLYGGSRSGKSAVICRRIIVRALLAPRSRHAIFRHKLNAARASIWKGTLREMMRLCWPGLIEQCQFNETDMLVTLPNGSTILVSGLDDSDRVDKVLGLEFSTIFLNEATQIEWASVSTVLTRLSQKVALGDNPEKFQAPKFFADCNPTGKRSWLYQQFELKLKPGTSEALSNPDNYVSMKLNPYDNQENIDADYLSSLGDLSSRAKKRFLEGDWASDVEGALFTSEIIERNRITSDQVPELVRIVVGVDPAMSSGESADATGIVVSGIDAGGHAYVLADRTQKNATPEQWGRAVIAAYKEFDADLVVAERNAGGALIENLLRSIDRNIPFKSLWSSRGKVSRSEPVSSCYERDLVSHVGTFNELEEELCSLVPGFNAKTAGHSPDHADAAVFALSELLLGKNVGGAKVVALKGW